MLKHLLNLNHYFLPNRCERNVAYMNPANYSNWFEYVVSSYKCYNFLFFVMRPGSDDVAFYHHLTLVT